MGRWWSEIRLWLGIEKNSTSHTEKWLSVIGGAFAIVSVYWATYWMFPFAGDSANAFILMVASMGASAVLLFAVPHGALSQPWQVFGGHLISAAIGVTCQILIDPPLLAACLAVGLAIGAMHYARCIHPPGGATALVAVVGGAEVHDLGYFFLVMPVLTNVIAILIAAVLFNSLAVHRRYPTQFARRTRPVVAAAPALREFDLTQEDFAAAINELDSFVDVSVESLTDLLELAKKHSNKERPPLTSIEYGHTYSNGKLGSLWSVRHVLPITEQLVSDAGVVHYAVVAGQGVGQNGECTLEDFKHFARFQVVCQDGQWVRLQDLDD